MSKLKFLHKFIKNRREIGSITPSSRFLANKVVRKSDIKNSQVIVELWAWTWSFTKKIFENLGEEKQKKIFIIEKDKDLYELLLKKFPTKKQYIFNIDVLDIKELLIKNKVNSVDLIISWLPFKSLPLEIFYFIMKEFLPEFSNKNTLFIQFSYFKNFSLMLEDYFFYVEKKICFLNIPFANIFRCKKFWNKKC